MDTISLYRAQTGLFAPVAARKSSEGRKLVHRKGRKKTAQSSKCCKQKRSPQKTRTTEIYTKRDPSSEKYEHLLLDKPKSPLPGYKLIYLLVFVAVYFVAKIYRNSTINVSSKENWTVKYEGDFTISNYGYVSSNSLYPWNEKENVVLVMETDFKDDKNSYMVNAPFSENFSSFGGEWTGTYRMDNIIHNETTQQLSNIFYSQVCLQCDYESHHIRCIKNEIQANSCGRSDVYQSSLSYYKFNFGLETYLTHFNNFFLDTNHDNINFAVRSSIGLKDFIAIAEMVCKHFDTADVILNGSESFSNRTFSYLLGNSGMHCYHGNPPKRNIQDPHFMEMMMVREVSDYLSPTGAKWKRFMNLLRQYFTPVLLAQCKSIYDVFFGLKTTGRISLGRYDILLDMYIRIGHIMAYNVVKKYTKQIQEAIELSKEEEMDSNENRDHSERFRSRNLSVQKTEPFDLIPKKKKIKHQDDESSTRASFEKKYDITVSELHNSPTIDWTDLKAFPAYIESVSDEDRKLYMDSLKDGEEKYRHIRVIFVGEERVGKTTLCKFLTEKDINLDDEPSTEGADIFIELFEINMVTKDWISLENNQKEVVVIRLGDVVAANRKTQDTSDTVEIIYSQDPTSPSQNKIPSDDNECSALEQSRETSVTSEQTDNELERQVVQSSIKNSKERSHVSLWDFAGQEIYHATHHVFFSPDGVYVVVCNAQICLEGTDKEKTESADKIVNWLRSIMTYSNKKGKGNTKSPPIILVGTHADKLQPDKTQDNFQAFAASLLADYDVTGIKMNWCFLVDYSKDRREALDKLREMVIGAALYQEQWNKIIPVKWLTLEHSIMVKKAEGKKVMSLDAVHHLNNNLQMSIQDDKELKLFLRYLHASRMVIYFEEDEILSKNVIIDPKWLIGAFCCLITKECFVEKSNPSLLYRWSAFQKTAKLDDELMDCVWKTPYDEYKDILKALMLRFGLISQPAVCASSENTETYFIVPSILHSVGKDELKTKIEPLTKHSCSLFLNFEGQFIPKEIYDRLLANCISRWKPFEKLENCVFRKVGIFRFDIMWSFLLYCDISFISLTVFRRKGCGKKLVGKTVRNEIEEMLKNVFELNGQNFEYRYDFYCDIFPENRQVLIPLEDVKSNEQVTCTCCEGGHYITLKDIQFWGLEDDPDDADNQAVSEKVKLLHNKMVFDISGLLSPELDDWNGFLTLLKTYFNKVEIKNTTSVDIACEKLMNKKKIKYGDYKVLLDIFKTMKMKGIRDIIKKYTEKITKQWEKEAK